MPRPLLAYPLAPVLGIAGGGPFLMVAIVTYAVILGAMPSLMKRFSPHPARAAQAEVEPEVEQAAPPAGDPGYAPGTTLASDARRRAIGGRPLNRR